MQNKHKLGNTASAVRRQFLSSVPELKLGTMDIALVSAVSRMPCFKSGMVVELTNSELKELAERGLRLPGKFLLWKGRARV